MQLIFFSVVVGMPLTICLVGVIGAYFQDDDAWLIDLARTRSAELEARMRRSEVDQMLAVVNRSRRARGADERSLEDFSPPPGNARSRLD